MNQTLKRLPETQMKIFFLIYVVFAAATFYFSPLLSILEALVILLLLTYYLITKRRRQQKVTRFIAALNHNIDSAGKDTMMNSPFPMVIFRPENGEVIWSNDRFLSISGEREHLFDTHITAAVPDFSSNWLMEGRTECPTEYTIRGRR